MKSLVLALALGAATVPAFAGVSIAVGEPGFYGRINLGGFVPAPVVYGPRPVIIAPTRYAGAPVYLRVPGYQRVHWARYCGVYSACGLPVLFVNDDWYMRTYVPRYREHFGPHYGGRPPVRVVERVEYRGGPGRGHYEDHGRGPDHGHYDGHGGGHYDNHGGGHEGGHEGGHGGDHGGGDHGHR